MANFFDNLKEIRKEIANKLESRAEKRRNSVSYYMDKTKLEIKQAERMVEKQRELKSLFYKERKELESYIEKRRHQAKIASEANEAKLAEFAQREVEQYTEQLKTTKEHYNEANEQLEQLESRMHEMRLKWKNLKTQYLAEMAKKNASETAQKMDKVIHDMSWGSVTEYHEAQKQRDLAEEANKKAQTTKEISQSFDELMDELEKKTEKSKDIIKDKAQDFTAMVEDIIEREKMNFKKTDKVSFDEQLKNLEKEAAKNNLSKDETIDKKTTSEETSIDSNEENKNNDNEK